MILGNRFVGRNEEIGQFERMVANHGEGSSTLLLISGHAGIGKTSLAREFHDIADRSGALAVWANFPEQADCPPYWGWISVCRALAKAVPESAAAALADEMSLPRNADHPQMQISHLQRLGDLLGDICRDSEIVLFFDDIQHADRSSMALLESFLSEMHSHPVIIVATFRDVQFETANAGNRALPRLAVLPQALRIVLRGIDELECAELCRELSGWTPDSSIARRLHRQTEGNPLFVRQIVQSLVDRGHIVDGKANLPARLTVPEGMSEAILLRLRRASQKCLKMLGKAAILGRSFDTQVVARLDPAFDPATLDEAGALGVLQPIDAALGRWQFSHALIREVLYDRVPPMQRARAHADAAAAIEAVYGADNPAILAALAYHAFEGQLFYGAQRVIEQACKAGAHATAVAAYEDAVAHYRLALDCFGVPGMSDVSEQIDVALKLASAERLSGDPIASVRTCREAMGLARAIPDWGRYTRAALQYEAARWQPGLPSNEVISCLQTAMEHADEVSEADVARIHFSLARAYQWQGDFERIKAHAMEAIRKSRKLDDDLLVCEAYDQAGSALHAIPGTSPLRLRLNNEGIEVARRTGDKARLANLLVNAGVINCEAGLMGRFREALAELGPLAKELAQPHLQYITHHWTSTIALLEGDFARAASFADAAAQLGNRITGANAAGIRGVQIFMINRERGILDDFAQLARNIAAEKETKLWRPGYALLLAESGHVEEAAEVLRDLVNGGLDNLPGDDMRQVTLAFLADVAWLSRDAESARKLFFKLKIDAGMAATCGPASVCFGPVDRSLGKLEACMQNYAEAGRWLELALQQARDWDSRPTELRTACVFCEVLLEDGSPSAIKRARELESDYAGKAAEIGMRSIARRFDAVSTRLRNLASTHGFDVLTAREVEVLRVLSRGASNAEISRDLGISMATTATHVRNILAKTNSKNRTAAAAFARQAGLSLN